MWRQECEIIHWQSLPLLKSRHQSYASLEELVARKLKRPEISFRPSLTHTQPYGLLTVLLDARGAQAGKAVTFDGTLPTQIFLNSEGITLAGFF